MGIHGPLNISEVGSGATEEFMNDKFILATICLMTPYSGKESDRLHANMLRVFNH
jgi:hypothetical protein